MQCLLYKLPRQTSVFFQLRMTLNSFFIIHVAVFLVAFSFSSLVAVAVFTDSRLPAFIYGKKIPPQLLEFSIRLTIIFPSSPFTPSSKHVRY